MSAVHVVQSAVSSNGYFQANIAHDVINLVDDLYRLKVWIQKGVDEEQTDIS